MHVLPILPWLLGLYSPSRWTSYCKISWSLEAARFGFKLFQLLWSLSGTSNALQISKWNDHYNIQSRGFERYGGKTSYRWVNRGPEWNHRMTLFCRTGVYVTYVSQLDLHTTGTHMYRGRWSHLPHVCTHKHSGLMLQTDTEAGGLYSLCLSGCCRGTVVRQLRHQGWGSRCHWGRCGPRTGNTVTGDNISIHMCWQTNSVRQMFNMLCLHSLTS